MSYKIYATKRFLKEFSKYDASLQERVKKKISELRENPHLGIPLTAEFKGKYKLRIGDFRVIYEIDHQNARIFLLAIGPRKNIYDRSKEE